MSFAITNYLDDGGGQVELICSGGITGGASNGLYHKLITVSGFSGTDSNGFDTTALNGTWLCTQSGSTEVVLEMYIPYPHTINHTCSGPVLAIGSDAVVEGFFLDGWAVPSALVTSGGVAGFFLDGWLLPNFLVVQSPSFHTLLEALHPIEGQLFPTGQVNDSDYFVVRARN